MEIDRRTLMHGAAASLLLPWARLAAKASEQAPLYAAAYRADGGGFGAALFHQDGTLKNTVALPDRGHGFAVDARRQRVVAFARRPGNFAFCLSQDNAQQPLWFSPPRGRHFYGHGIFSPDGRILYATENQIETSDGIIGLYDATDGFKPLGAFQTGGIGPHDLAIMPDSRTLLVANGGIKTHPDFGREELNIETMRPSLTYLDTQTGEIRETVQLSKDLHKLSLRHLAVNEAGLAIIGCQHKGARNEQPDLVLTHRIGGEPRALALPGDAAQMLNNYVSAVAIDASGRYAAVTSSKGGVVLVIDLEQRRLVKKNQLADVSGIAPAPALAGAFFVTAGTSAVGEFGLNEPGVATHQTGMAWDNHVVRVS